MFKCVEARIVERHIEQKKIVQKKRTYAYPGLLLTHCSLSFSCIRIETLKLLVQCWNKHNPLKEKSKAACILKFFLFIIDMLEFESPVCIHTVSTTILMICSLCSVVFLLHAHFCSILLAPIVSAPAAVQFFFPLRFLSYGLL